MEEGKNEGTTEKKNCRAFSILLLFPFEEDREKDPPLSFRRGVGGEAPLFSVDLGEFLAEGFAAQVAGDNLTLRVDE